MRNGVWYIVSIILLFFLYPSVKSDHYKSSYSESSYAVADFDSLVSLWHIRSSTGNLVQDTIMDYPSVYEAGDISDSIYIERLAAINSPVNFNFNNQVRAYIRLYTENRREQMANMLGLSQYYFPIFEEVLDAYNLPLELKYLTVVESALNPRALSPAGASGIWQFMYRTGRSYGLEVNSYIDERRDPIKATHAAAQYLSDLYDIYGDWQLVLAAYNCGPGNLNRAIRRSGGARDFWSVYYRLPRETRGYIPAFTGAVYAFEYAKEHGLEKNPISFPVATDTVMINKPLHFEQLSGILNLPVEVLRELNPQYRRDIVPAQNKPYPLKLSFNSTMEFASFEDSIYAYRREEFFPSGNIIAEPSRAAHSAVAPSGHVPVSYTVQSGDVVGLIAERFNVRAADLRYWNNISRNLIRVGQTLTIYVPENRREYYETISSGSVSNSGSTEIVANTDGDGSEFIYYSVRSGDNLWVIARQYPGVSSDDIIRLNNLGSGGEIKPGQRLKIMVKE
ncbi:transglycosylase SLT domain-containing protein [Marinilabiliaceae bacterium ANBcel2]|nr:transglycosylase SLT domain-containing protein [Marinilabiliaceae bacterium ANBcel2]